MPPPRLNTPEETFGFASVPLSSYFKLPKGGSANTQFSPAARAEFQKVEEQQRLQRQQEADMLVEGLLNGAADMTDEEINQALIDNPQAYQSRNLGALRTYQQERQAVRPPTMADQQLGQYYFSRIQEDKDPRHLQTFQRRMLQEGMDANSAWEAYRQDQFNEPLMQTLAEAGVPREEFDTLKDATGHLDPVEVSRRVAAAKAQAKAATLGRRAEPLDEEIELLKDAAKTTADEIEATTDAEKLALLKARKESYTMRLQKAMDEKLSKLRPAEAGGVAPVAGQAPKPSAFLQNALKISEIPVTKAP